ncbi:MAG: hypothetical protein GXO75_07390 [Calditrichaeota bacterium]|nr:hypothetical protein [Calditrichota bacterium]
MRIAYKKYPGFIFLIVVLSFLPGCKIDHGLDIMKSKITGDVIFLNPDKRPDYVESVRIVAAVKFPFTSLSDVVFMNTSINLSKEKSAYEIPAPISTYQVVAAVWKEKGQAWNYTNLLGIYGFNPLSGQFEFKKVILTKNDPVARGIDIYCDWSTLRP